MTNAVKGFNVKDRKIGEIKFAVYCANRLGNLRMGVDGKLYSDKEFTKKFIKI